MKNVITIFNQILNLIPYSQIQNATDKFNGDKYSKKFKTYHHLVTLLYAQITEKDSLQQEFTEGTGIVSDELITLTGTTSSYNYPEVLRMVKYYDIEQDKLYTFITNNFKLAAKTIADIYKERWQVELFFKWIKQNLKIKSFLGTSENAVMTQIWVAMITYLIYSYMKFQTKSAFSILDFSRIIKETLFQKVSILDLLSLNPDSARNLDFDEGWKQLKLVF